jgi:hypothetical protein
MIFRRILALIVTIITLWVIKETIVIFTSDDADIAAKRGQLKIASVSLCIPLTLLSFWLWRPKAKSN